MEDLTVYKVHRWLFWAMIITFGFITYLNFSEIVSQFIAFIFALPFWFMLTAGVLITFLILNLVVQGQEKIEELEEVVWEERRAVVGLERRFRLARQDPAALSSASFKRFCADVLRHLGYEKIQSVPDQIRGVDWQVTGSGGAQLFVACASGNEERLRGEVHQLYYEMLKRGIASGMLITPGYINQEMERWAKSLGVVCLNSKKATHIAYHFIENG